MKNRGFLNLSQNISALNLKSLSTVSELKELKFYRCVIILNERKGLGIPDLPPYLRHRWWITAAYWCLACCDRDDERLTQGGRVAWHRDELAARLSISNLELTDAGVYTCVARCASGVTRCSAELSVFDAKLAKDSCLLQPPIFVRGVVPPERAVVEGEPVELTVKLEGTSDDSDHRPFLWGNLCVWDSDFCADGRAFAPPFSYFSNDPSRILLFSQPMRKRNALFRLKDGRLRVREKTRVGIGFDEL